jgi:hypothetical protein
MYFAEDRVLTGQFNAACVAKRGAALHRSNDLWLNRAAIRL